LFVFANIVDQIALKRKSKILEYFSKPLIVPSILGLYFILCPVVANKIVIALVLYTVGDIFLMLPDKGGYFFVIGLISFLIGHVYYMLWFIRLPSPGVLWFSCLLLIPFIAIFVYIIIKALKTKNPLGPLLVPYACVLIAFEICVSFSAGPNNMLATLIGVFGVASYAFSDTLIGLKGLKIKESSDNLIMQTYALAQVLLLISVLMLCKVYF